MAEPALNELRHVVAACRRCDLAKTRTKIVFGVGNQTADLMFVGEAPGYYEDQKGEPFVGSAGQLLDKLLESIGLNRNDVYIANVLKCRPPQNRNPKPEEIEACRSYLDQQIKIIKPKIIATLGNFATRLVLDKSVSISKVRGHIFQGNSHIIMPIYHPAAALYTRSTLAALKEDFLKLKELLAADMEAPADPEQTSLF